MSRIWLFLSSLGHTREYGVEVSEHGILTGQFWPKRSGEKMQKMWLFLSSLEHTREYGVEISERGILTGQLRLGSDAEDLAVSERSGAHAKVRRSSCEKKDVEDVGCF